MGEFDDPHWHIADVVRWNGYTNVLNFDRDKATADYVAAVNPQAILSLLDELERLRSACEDSEDAKPDNLTVEDVAMISSGLGWSISEGGLEAKDSLPLVKKLGLDVNEWEDIYGT